jgi:hypothetical protein
MTSSISPHLTDAELLAWLDDDNALAEHIARCPACQTRARMLQAENHRLQVRLYRADCPPAYELGEYGLGLLSPSRLDEIAEHLARCPHCRQELAIQQIFLAGLATEAAPETRSAPVDQIRVVIATLVQDFRAGWQGMGGMQPAMAAMRGKENRPQIYDAGDYQLSLEFQEDPANPGRRALFGLLIGDDEPASFEVQIWLDDVLVAHVPVDDFGNFSISGLQPANYEMKLIRPQLAIHLNDVSI